MQQQNFNRVDNRQTQVNHKDEKFQKIFNYRWLRTYRTWMPEDNTICVKFINLMAISLLFSPL